MTKEQAILIFKDLYLDEVFIQGKDITDYLDTVENEINKGNLDAVNWVIDTLVSINQPYEDVKAMLNGDCEFLNMDGSRTGDEHDYIILYKDENTFHVWTEVGGKEYDVKKLNTKFKIKRI